MKTTEWFPVWINPVHVGEYECRYGNGPHIARFAWDGKTWNFCGGHGKPAWISTYREGDAWRGLTEPA